MIECKETIFDFTKAIAGLDTFTKHYCQIKYSIDDLEFRCHNCLFCNEDGVCLIKKAAHTIPSNYDLNNFGAMSR